MIIVLKKFSQKIATVTKDIHLPQLRMKKSQQEASYSFILGFEINVPSHSLSNFSKFSKYPRAFSKAQHFLKFRYKYHAVTLFKSYYLSNHSKTLQAHVFKPLSLLLGIQF